MSVMCALRTVVLIATFSGGLHFALVYLAIDRLDAATGAICYQLGTPITVLVAWAWLGDRPTGACVPDARGPVLAGGYHELPVTAKGSAMDRALMTEHQCD